jgi:hypothetical protein
MAEPGQVELALALNDATGGVNGLLHTTGKMALSILYPQELDELV